MSMVWPCHSVVDDLSEKCINVYIKKVKLINHDCHFVNCDSLVLQTGSDHLLQVHCSTHCVPPYWTYNIYNII